MHRAAAQFAERTAADGLMTAVTTSLLAKAGAPAVPVKAKELLLKQLAEPMHVLPATIQAIRSSTLFVDALPLSPGGKDFLKKKMDEMGLIIFSLAGIERPIDLHDHLTAVSQLASGMAVQIIRLVIAMRAAKHTFLDHSQLEF